MSRPAIALFAAFAIFLTGCLSIAGVAIDSASDPLSIVVATTVLAGDTAQATAISTHRSGHLEIVSATWRSSDASVISIDASGRMVAHLEGRSATIFADFEGQTASASVSVASDDKRFGYAFADQPTAAAPYSPDAAYRFNSSGGVIEVTRALVGAYSVRFGGLVRPAGGRDNVQVTGYGTPGTYCKPSGVATNPLPGWNSIGSDLVVPVNCWTAGGTPADSRFTILMIGARGLGASTALGFALGFADVGTVLLDTTVTARNSTGGRISAGRIGEGNYSLQFQGLGKASAGAKVAYQVTAAGLGAGRCRIVAVDQPNDGVGINCTRPVGGDVGDSPFSVLWFTRGRPNLRFGFAWANNPGSTVDYTPDPTFALSSSGGSITARRTGTGTYRVVFGGLGRPGGGTENVQLSPAFLGSSQHICNITSWGNTGANDLTVSVACYDLTGVPANNAVFNVLVVE